MNRTQITEQIKAKHSYLCVGLDTDMTKLPASVRKAEDPIFEFNRRIIDATHRYCVAYKPNLAFYEALGSKGWESLQKTMEYIPKEIFTIADAKRGDIGNTSTLYARAFFEQLKADAVTVAPYMGEDSVKPFLQFPDKWVIVLVHTSNPGSADFQLIKNEATGRPLYEEVIQKVSGWGTPDNLMFVVGATHPDKMKHIRGLAPHHFFLVPGVGAQGGDLGEISRAGLNADGGLLVNSSRNILYASSGDDFAEAAMRECVRMQEEMKPLLQAIR
jgi:orotidine-5'-phosphate decarboxylase